MYITPDKPLSQKIIEQLNKDNHINLVLDSKDYLLAINNQFFNREDIYFFIPKDIDERIFLIIIDIDYIIFFSEIKWPWNNSREYNFKLSFYKKKDFKDFSTSKSYKEIIFNPFYDLIEEETDFKKETIDNLIHFIYTIGLNNFDEEKIYNVKEHLSLPF